AVHRGQRGRDDLRTVQGQRRRQADRPALRRHPMAGREEGNHLAQGGGDGRGQTAESGVGMTDPIVARGRYFDELAPGQVYQHRPGRTVGEADNTLFSTLTMNPQSLHLDAAYSAGTEFGQRLVNSLFTLDRK